MSYVVLLFVASEPRIIAGERPRTRNKVPLPPGKQRASNWEEDLAFNLLSLWQNDVQGLRFFRWPSLRFCSAILVLRLIPFSFVELRWVCCSVVGTESRSR